MRTDHFCNKRVKAANQFTGRLIIMAQRALNHLTKSLDLTADQQAKVQPLLDQARPQIIAIHKDAMEKTHAIIDKTMSQIRPLLTTDQQKKFDDLQKARQDMRNAMQEMHNAMTE